MVDGVKELDVGHILIFVIVAFVLYQLISRYRCLNNGFRVGGQDNLINISKNLGLSDMCSSPPCQTGYSKRYRKLPLYNDPAEPWNPWDPCNEGSTNKRSCEDIYIEDNTNKDKSNRWGSCWWGILSSSMGSDDGCYGSSIVQKDDWCIEQPDKKSACCRID